MKIASLIAVLLACFNLNTTHAETNTSKSTIKLWQTYEAWLENNYPAGIKDLNAGTSEELFKKLESKIGNKLPDKYREWLTVHNGQKSSAAGLLVGGEFFSTDGILAEWQIMETLLDEGKFNFQSESDPKGKIKTDWWNKNWIPISGDGAGNLICLDMSPDKNGSMGQVIDFDHETVDRTVLADSFEEYIGNYINDLKSGQYKYSDEYGLILPLEDL